MGRQDKGVYGLKKTAHHVARHEYPKELLIAYHVPKGLLLALVEMWLIGLYSRLVAAYNGVPGLAAEHVDALPQGLQLLVMPEGFKVREGLQQAAVQHIGVQGLLISLVELFSVQLHDLGPLFGAGGVLKQPLAQLVGVGFKPRGHQVEHFQLAVEPYNGHHGYRQVRNKEPAQHCQQHPPQGLRHKVRQAAGGGHDKAHHHRARKAPEYGEFQADIAVQVVGFIGIVPPLLTEYLFQQETRRPLESRAQYHGAYKQRQQVAREGAHKQGDKRHAYAVDGTDGTVEETPVHKALLHGRGIEHLCAPAEERVNEKAVQVSIKHNKPSARRRYAGTQTILPKYK